MSSSRANPVTVLLFGVAVAAAILLTGPLLLFAPPFVSFEQGRHDVPALLGTDQATVDRATSSMLGDLLFDGDFAASITDDGAPVLDAAERSHMRDVGGVVRALVLVELLAVLLVVVGWVLLRGAPAQRGSAMLRAAAGIGALAVVLAAFFGLAFEAAFSAFHAVFFPQGNWQFGPDSNLLRFFPEPFFFEIALIAGVTIVLAAVLVALLGRRDLAHDAAAG
jgi:integral membrane protein (TIGR01906 family)